MWTQGNQNYIEEKPHGDSEKVATCKPKREASGEAKPANTLILDSSLQNYDKINFHCCSHPACGVLYGSTLRPREGGRKGHPGPTGTGHRAETSRVASMGRQPC